MYLESMRKGLDMNEYHQVREDSNVLRPYEKCLKFGAGMLSDAELLAVILRTGAVGTDSVTLASQILQLAPGRKGLSGLYQLSVEELCCLKGVGSVKAIQVQCIGELSRRISKSIAAEGISMNQPATIAQYYMEDLRHLTQEHMLLLLLNSKTKLIRDMVLFKGTVNGAMLSPREVLIEALRSNAVYMVLLHNHPSGDPEPSREDIGITKRIKEAGKIVGIQLIDHIIIGDNQYISLKERGVL